MTNPDNTIRVVIPLTIRKRNGRPRIVAPSENESAADRVQDPRLLRALARAWSWRRQLESGTATTIHDSAAVENVTDRFIGRMIRLAYLSPDVLEELVIARRPSSITINDLTGIADLPWVEQKTRVFA